MRRSNEPLAISGRDKKVADFVAKFRQVSASHIHTALFSNLQSRTPADRALQRLCKAGYLHRIERRSIGGAYGGSGLYVYTLGPRGHAIYGRDGKFTPSRALNYHTLSIVDTYISLLELERTEQLEIAGIATEPECHMVVGGKWIKPDMFVELRMSTGKELKLWLEIDMGTERQSIIKGKFETYWRAYQDAHLPAFPITVFIAVDDDRAKELQWLLTQGSQDAQQLFRITTGPDFRRLLRGWSSYPQISEVAGIK